MIAGLGNPGPEYVGTRHNVGFRVIDSLASALKIDVGKKKFGACFGLGRIQAGSNEKLILLKPQQFINRSGQVVATAAGFYRVGVDKLFVVTDDMALEPGSIRIRAKGSAGGHKGLADVIEKLGTEDVARLRIGIGQCGEDTAYDYVLDKPTEAEGKLLDEAIEMAREAVICWVKYGVEKAMNDFNN